jgi:Fe-S-cluster-containing dehydrogenase component
MEICPTGARIYGDLKDRDSKLVNFLRTHDYQVLKPHLNTGSKLFYNALTAEIS